MKTAYYTMTLLAGIAGYTGCAEVELETDVTQLASSTTLDTDLTLECDTSGEVKTTSSDTEVTINMNSGDLLYVQGTVATEYLPEGASYAKSLVGTRLACKAGDSSVVTTSPQIADIESRSGTNQWDRDPGYDNIYKTHITKAIYEATTSGDHTCWIVYACNGKTDHDWKILKDDTYLRYYSANAYPGINWIEQDDYLIDSTSTHTPGGSRIWDAGTTTSGDTEVVGFWQPHLTNCLDEARETQCHTPYDGDDDSTHFSWRLVVYQYNGNNLCNRNFSSWSSTITCPYDDHHCGTSAYTTVFDIITGTGNYNSQNCGTTSASRKFKLYGQIKKTDATDSDIQLHARNFDSQVINNHTNIGIYSR